MAPSLTLTTTGLAAFTSSSRTYPTSKNPASGTPWHTLPAELKLAVVDALDRPSVRALARTDTTTYRACVPALFRTVRLDTLDAVSAFLASVPPAYLAYIDTLDVCSAPSAARSRSGSFALSHASSPSHTHSQAARLSPTQQRSALLVRLLKHASRLSTLTLRVFGGLDKSVMAPFNAMDKLRKLSLMNVGDEVSAPLSERLVVSIAFSVPHLTSLTLSRVTRSAMHAPDLVGTGTYVPLATCDTDIPHPSTALSLDTPLSLPTLLLLPSLTRLALKDIHLGDARWGSTTPLAKLEMLDIGPCGYESEAFNASCTQRIVAAVGESLSEVGIGAALGTAAGAVLPAPPTVAALAWAPSPANGTVQNPTAASAQPSSLSALKKLSISPYFPLERVVDTMSALAASPVESVRIECFAEDVVDVCRCVEEFLVLRGEREKGKNNNDAQREAIDKEKKEGWFANLQTIWVGVRDEDNEEGVDGDDSEEDGDEPQSAASCFSYPWSPSPNSWDCASPSSSFTSYDAEDVCASPSSHFGPSAFAEVTNQNEEDADSDDDDPESPVAQHRAARRLEALCAGFNLGGGVQDTRARFKGLTRAVGLSRASPVYCSSPLSAHPLSYPVSVGPSSGAAAKVENATAIEARKAKGRSMTL